MVPALAQHAAKFENRDDLPPLFGSWNDSLPLYHGDGPPDPAMNGMTPAQKMQAAAALWDKALAFPDIKGGRRDVPPGPTFDGDMQGYASLFESKFDAFWKSVAPENGGSVTLSHGDLRGDNLFFTDSNDEGWLAIDFQLCFKGPIPSDLAYLMSSGTVLPEVYNDGLPEVLRLFYDEFQQHTTAYKTADYSFEKFEEEFYKMSHVLFTYLIAMGAGYAFSGAADGKVDPSKPDEVTGPLACAPELGSGSVTEADLDEASMRTRMWGSKREPNFAAVFRRYGGKATLEALGGKVEPEAEPEAESEAEAEPEAEPEAEYQ